MIEIKPLTGRSLAGASTNRKRVSNDYYATPEDAVKSLLKSFNLDCDTFYEPACGEGHISKILKQEYSDKEIYSTDLIDRGYGIGGIDFLTLKTERRWDCIITNPPFKLSQKFIEKGLEFSNKYVIMFAKIQLLEGIERRKLFDKNPPKYIYVFTNRVNPLRNGSSTDENGKKLVTTMCFSWFIWEKGFKGEPIIRWLNTKHYM